MESTRALQRVLYRSAKQQPNRKFHALYDKVARSDVLARAFSEVRANRGAPGVDGVSIADIETSGVERFLQDLATALRDRTYTSNGCLLRGISHEFFALRPLPERGRTEACVTALLCLPSLPGEQAHRDHRSLLLGNGTKNLSYERAGRIVVVGEVAVLDVGRREETGTHLPSLCEQLLLENEVTGKAIEPVDDKPLGLAAFQVLEGVTEARPRLQSVATGDPRIGELADQAMLLLGCP